MSIGNALPLLGIDFGGTGTRLSLANPDGTELVSKIVSTRIFQNHPTEVLIKLISEFLDPKRQIAGIGIGASGPVNLKTGIIENPDTLIELTGIPLVEPLSKHFNVPVCIDNDAVVAALAEFEWGLGKDRESLLCVTLGTGIGIAAINQSGAVRALDGEHPEAGHISIGYGNYPCYCGLSSCWEQAASRTALEKLLQDNQSPWEAYASLLASGLATLITIYRPKTICFSGSASQYFDFFINPLKRQLGLSRDFNQDILFGKTQLGDSSGALGATLLVTKKLGFTS
jgi:glucokinase